MPGSYCYPLLVQNRADVVRVDSLKNERNDACLFACGSNDPNSRNNLKSICSETKQILLVTGDVVNSQ